MRFDDAPPRTWLFAVLAGWAVLAWVLALAGLGRRISPLDPDPSLLPTLPKPQATVASRLGPAQQYSAISERPLFSSDRKPKPFVLKADNEGGEQAKPFDYVLTSVLLGPRTQIAIVQPTGGGDSVSFKLNESAVAVPSWRLVAVEPRSATFTGPEGERTLELRKFDGNGGQPATASAVQGARPGQPGAAPRLPVPPVAAPNTTRTANAQRPPAPAVQPQEATDAPPDPNGRPQQQDQQNQQNQQSAEAEAQIEAIRRRIQARREQLRREAEQAPPSNNP